MAPVRLAFYRGTGLTGWAIRTVTWSDYDHVALLLPDGSVLDVEPGAGVSEHATVRVADAVFAVDAPDSACDHAVAFAMQQIGKPYDWTAVIGIGLHRDWRQTDSFFCSELVALAFENAGCPLLHANHVNRVTPGDLLMSPLLRAVP